MRRLIRRADCPFCDDSEWVLNPVTASDQYMVEPQVGQEWRHFDSTEVMIVGEDGPYFIVHRLARPYLIDTLRLHGRIRKDRLVRRRGWMPLIRAIDERSDHQLRWISGARRGTTWPISGTAAFAGDIRAVTEAGGGVTVLRTTEPDGSYSVARLVEKDRDINAALGEAESAGYLVHVELSEDRFEARIRLMRG